MSILKNKLPKAAAAIVTAVCIFTALAQTLVCRAYAQQSGEFENEVFQEGAGEGQVKTGYAYEYYQKLSEYTGWRYEYVYGDFGELYEMLVNGEIDLLAGLAYTEERKDIIGYPDAPMGNETYSLVKHETDTDITAQPSTLSGKRIGVLDSAIVGVLENYLDSHGITAKVVSFSSYSDLFAAFDSGNVDVLAAEGDGAYGRENAEVLCAFGKSDYYLCVSPKRPDLLSELDSAQAELASSEPNYINLLKIKYYSVSVSGRAFSAAEKEWLNGHGTLRIGYLNNYLPYSDTDKDGNVTGLIKELMPEMINSLGIEGLNVTYTGYGRYDDMIAAMSDGSIDAAFPVGGGLYYSEINGICQSNAVLSSSTELIYRGDYSPDTVQHFAVNENNRMQYYYVMTNFPNSEITLYPSIEQCLDAVLSGKAGCTTLNGVRANDILKNSRYRDLSMKQLSSSDARCFGIMIGNEGLLKLLNRGVNVVGSDYVTNTAYKYTNGLYEYTFADMLGDYSWLFAIIVIAVAALIILFLTRESARNRKEMQAKENARITLEAKNKELAESRAALIETNEKLEITAREAERANQAKTYFLSSMSHDIRTPMNSILSMNEMILRESDDEDIITYSEHIRASGSTLLGLINDILDFSRIEAGKLEIISEEYELASVLNDLVNTVKTKADEKGLSFILNIDSSLPNYLRGDEIRIKQAVTNILTNAVKYTKKGSVTFTVGYENIEDEPDCIMLNISVEDTGIGIKEEDIAKLFAAFERIDEANNRNIEGTGLGITITQRLLGLMGSELKVKSEYGKGSEFSFSVKQQVVRRDEVGDYEMAFRRSVAERKTYHEKFTAPDAHILAVDDTPVNLTVFRSLLKRTKINIDTAESGDECIALVRERKYDMIFLDHMMPIKDGMETLKEMKELVSSPNADTPVICLTANALTGMREVYISAGFNDHLTKPIDPDQLENLLIKYLPEDMIQPPDIDEDSENVGTIPEIMYRIDAIDVASGLRHCGTPDVYMATVRTFLDTAYDNADEMENYLNCGDMHSLTVKVHALKSTSRVIGAKALGAFAEALEKAGNEGDEATLRGGIGKLLSDYRSLADKLSPVRGSITDDNKPPMDDETLREAYATILEFSESLDYDSMVYVIKSLDGYTIPSGENERVEKLKNAALGFDYELIPEILNGI